MTDNRLTAKTELTGTPNVNDVLYIVDVSDTTDSPEGTSKKVKYSNLVNSLEFVTQSFSSTIKTDKFYISADSNIHTQVSVINFASDLTDAKINGGAQIEIIGGGFDISFDENFGSISTDLIVTNNSMTLSTSIVYRIIAFYNGSKIDLSISEVENIVVPSLILMQDDFNDNSIDPLKWDLLGAFGNITENSNRLEVNYPHTGTLVANYFDNALKSKLTVNSGKIVSKFTIETENALRDTALTHFGICQNGSDFNVNSAKFIDSGTVAGTFKAQVWAAGVKQYDFETGIGNIADLRVGYDFGTNKIRFEHWNGVTWVLIGSEQTYDIAGVGSLDFYISMNDAAVSTAIDYAYFDNAYITSDYYITQNP